MKYKITFNGWTWKNVYSPAPSMHFTPTQWQNWKLMVNMQLSQSRIKYQKCCNYCITRSRLVWNIPHKQMRKKKRSESKHRLRQIGSPRHQDKVFWCSISRIQENGREDTEHPQPVWHSDSLTTWDIGEEQSAGGRERCVPQWPIFPWQFDSIFHSILFV